MSEAIAGDVNVLTKGRTNIALPVLGACTEAGNCGSSEAATEGLETGLETGRDKPDESVCEGVGKDEMTDRLIYLRRSEQRTEGCDNRGC